MAGTEELKQFEVRIARIESLLEKAVARRQVVDLTAEEISAYQKVREVIAADWGDFCGINDCFRCTIIRCSRCFGPIPLCRQCDVECYCGPCALCATGRYGGGLRRFSELGD